jgi:site-specific DNA-methyltransferase (adenine-specific)
MVLNTYYKKDDFELFFEDAVKVLNRLPEKSVDMIFADPPYFLSGDGVTCQSGEMVSVKKGKWDEKISAEERLEFDRKWIKEAYQVLSDNGTIWISGTLHSIYSIGFALELEGFKIMNNITWKKLNPPPNLACRYFTHSTETILWAKKNNKKSKHTFNYLKMKEINLNKQMKDVWEFPAISKKEKFFGYHPTQKPLSLLERIIIASTNENDLVLDPFTGTSTTGIAAIKYHRKFIGVDTEKAYLDISIKRYEDIKEKNNAKF